MREGPSAVTERVWDLPLRLVHWGFALGVPAMWWTAENNEMGWHMRIGMALLVLLVFRILWGFVGSTTARFSHFIAGPSRVLGYLTGKANAWPKRIGHNPAGGWSVIAMLGVMMIQVSLGLFSGDADDGVTGPLNGLVSYGTANSATEAHEVVFYGLLTLIFLHLGAIVFYQFIKHDNLVAPMVTGKKTGRSADNDGLEGAPAGRALLCLILALGFAWWIWSGAPLLTAHT